MKNVRRTRISLLVVSALLLDCVLHDAYLYIAAMLPLCYSLHMLKHNMNYRHFTLHSKPLLYLFCIHEGTCMGDR